MADEVEDKLIEAEVEKELAAVAEQLRKRLGDDVVSEAEAEVREQLRREIRDRLEVAAKKRAVSRKERARVKLALDEEEFERFSPRFRVQHIVLFTSCVLLIITGLPLKFPNTAWASVFFHLMGGVMASGVIHRIGATGLILVGAFHMIYIVLTKEGRYNFAELIPRFKDFKDVLRNVGYFLGKSKIGARFGRFSYVEKFDYWAVYWGMVVMITSGLMLWFQDTAMAILPKFFLDMAHEAHSDEALLATLAIIIWHFYNAHLNPDNFPMSWTWLTGKISKEKMIHHHPLEYEKIVAERRKLTKGNGKKERSLRVGEE
jgi:cytochrome b subunit of formate dehydrogenase